MSSCRQLKPYSLNGIDSAGTHRKYCLELQAESYNFKISVFKRFLEFLFQKKI